MSPPKGIMSLTKPKQRVSARDSRAVDQVLDNTTQMLGKLDKKTLGLLLQLTQYIKANKPKYKELMANLEAKGSLPPGVFPDEYDPKFLSVFALSVAKAQQAKNGMAAGGIAGIAQTMKDQGRGKDTMLAHISPEEAELLEKRGGVGTINPVTGLPEYGIFDDIGNALSGVGNAVGSVLKPVGDLIGGVLSSPLGLAATAAAAYYFMGPGAGAVVPSVAEAALPGALATEAATTALTPAAIEAGIGSAGYGYNASAAASGLFDPATIGSGAAIGAPSTTDKLLSANLLKNVKLSSGEEEQSDPNALIKMLMMYEMMGSKQNQPTNIPLPELTAATSSLPYDTPKKKMSSFISQPTQAAGGGLMTKNLGIGGLSAKRSQTDYAKNYLPGSGYRPGQGGVTYFTPMSYEPSLPAPSLPVEPTPSPIDELVDQTIGRPGGGGGDSAEAAAQREIDANTPNAMFNGLTRNEYYSLTKEERAAVDAQVAKDNPIKAGLIKAAKLVLAPGMYLYDLLNPTPVVEDPLYAAIKAADLEAMLTRDRAFESSIEGITASDAANAEMQRVTDEEANIARMKDAIAEQENPDDVRAALMEQDADRANEARIDALIASLPDAQQVRPSDMGAMPLFKQNNPDTDTWGGGINAKQGVRTALNPFPGVVDRAINNQTQNVGNYIPGQFRGAYLPEGLATDPYANIDVTAISQADEAALKAEQARVAAAEEKAYAERMAANVVDSAGNIYTPQEAYSKLVKDRDVLEKQYFAGVDAFGDPLPQAYKDLIEKNVMGLNFHLEQLNNQGLLSPEASRDTYDRERRNLLEKNIEGFPDTPERDDQVHFVSDRLNTVLDRVNKLDSPFSDRFAPEMTTTGATQAYREDTANAINNLEPGDRFAPVDYSNQYLSPEAYQAEVDKLNAVDPNAEEAKPVTEGEKLDQFVQALLSMEPTQLGESIQLAALGDFNLGEGETFGDTIGNYSMFTPKEATTPLGVLSTAAIQQAYPGAFDQSPLASLAPTPYSYTGGPSLTSIANSFGNEGSVWTDGSGNPWVGIDGKFLLTGQGAAQNAFNESLAGQEAAMRAEIQSLQNRYPAPSGRDGADGNVMGAGAAPSDGGAPPSGAPAPSAPSNPGDSGRGGGGAHAGGNGGEGGGGVSRSDFGGGARDPAGRDSSGAPNARGGLIHPYANGGIANLHQYNLGSYSDGGRLLKGPGDGVSDSIPATIGRGQPARLADGEFVIPARIVSELGNGSTDAGARKLYAMMDRIQKVRRKTKNVAANTKAAKYLPA